MNHQPRQRTYRAVVTVLVAAIALMIALPATTLADDGDKLDERATTTWRPLVLERVARVSTTAVLQNKHKPGSWHRVPCKKGKRGTCKERTRYYFDHWGTIWVSNDAVDLTFGGKAVTSEFTDLSGSGSRYTVRFPRIWYKQKQKVTIDYDLPSVEAGVVKPTRIEDAYIHFCWYGEDADGGDAKAILPPGFEPIAHHYGQPRVDRTPDGVVLSSPGKKANPAEFFVCTEAIAPDLFESTYLTSDDGSSLVTIAAWPSDGDWARHMIAEVQTARPWLEEQLRSSLPATPLTILEVATQARLWGGADVAPVGGVIGVSEAATDAGVLSVPLARTWFGPDAVRDPWLAEGLAMWTGHAAIGSRCPEPVVPQIDGPETGTHETDTPEADTPEADTPEADPLDLGDWVVAGPVDEKATWDRSRYQSAVTCGIVEAAAESIGAEAMTAIVADLLASPAPVSATDWLVEVAVASDADTVSALRSRIAEVGLAL